MSNKDLLTDNQSNHSIFQLLNSINLKSKFVFNLIYDHLLFLKNENIPLGYEQLVSFSLMIEEDTPEKKILIKEILSNYGISL